MSDCTISGNDAMDGLGIRLGLYLQWFSTILSLGGTEEQASAMRDINVSFTISTLIGLIYITVTHETSAAEIVTIVSLCSGGAILSTAARPGEWVRGVLLPKKKGERIRMLLQNVLLAVVTYYQVWFFYRGMDTVGYASCKQYQFFFAKVSIYGWVRKVNTMIVTLWAAAATLVLLLSIYKSLFGCHENPRETSQSDDKGLTLSAIILALKITAFLILNAELTIRWNNIQNVQGMGTTGQLIPFTVGLLGFIKTSYVLVRSKIKEREKDLEKNGTPKDNSGSSGVNTPQTAVELGPLLER